MLQCIIVSIRYRRAIVSIERHMNGAVILCILVVSVGSILFVVVVVIQLKEKGTRPWNSTKSNSRSSLEHRILYIKVEMCMCGMYDVHTIVCVNMYMCIGSSVLSMYLYTIFWYAVSSSTEFVCSAEDFFYLFFFSHWKWFVFPVSIFILENIEF